MHSHWIQNDKLFKKPKLIRKIFLDSIFRTYNNIATSCSANAYGKYFVCPPLFKEPDWLLIQLVKSLAQITNGGYKWSM